MAITDTKIKNLKPQEKAYKVTDGNGLYVFVSKSGAKSFRHDGKLNGKRFTLTYGEYPDLSLAEARKQHLEAKALIKEGIDPRQKRKKDSLLEKTFSYYAEETMARMELRPSTEYKRRNRMKRHLYPVLDNKPVQDITAIDLLNLLKPLAEEGKRETARLLATYCRQTFDSLLSMQLIQTNPAESINRLLPKPKQSSNFAHISDSKKFAKLLRGIDRYQGDYAVKQALRLMPLVILRPHNIRFMKWEYIDLTHALITLPAEEMKMGRDHKVPLSNQALEIIESMRPITGENEYVFLTSHGQKQNKPMSENTLNQAVIRVKDEKTGAPLGRGVMTSHGFRHSASTFLNEMRYDPDAIELQLAHASADRVRATYNKAELLPERTKMMQAWADWLDSLKQNDNIITFHKAG